MVAGELRETQRTVSVPEGRMRDSLEDEQKQISNWGNRV